MDPVQRSKAFSILRVLQFWRFSLKVRPSKISWMPSWVCEKRRETYWSKGPACESLADVDLDLRETKREVFACSRDKEKKKGKKRNKKKVKDIYVNGCRKEWLSESF